jgi:IPT/TIG domain/PKD domain
VRRLPRGAVLVLLVGASLFAAYASSACALLAHLRNGRSLSYEALRGAAPAVFGPLDAFFANVEYNGGPIMASNTNYAFYWDPAGAPVYPAEYQSGVDQYFEDLEAASGGQENVDSVSAQYNDAAGQLASYDSHFGGAIIDEDPYPASGCKRAAICLTDAQLRAELRSYLAAHALPEDVTHDYYLLTPPGVESCFEASGAQCSAGTATAAFCAYHSDVELAPSVIVYADDPFVTGNEGCDDGNHPNGKPSDGAIEGGLAHEHEESITDPEPNSGWLDLENEQEVADKCRGGGEANEFGTPLGTAPNGAKYNQVINGRLYWYQQMWSNQGQRCLQRLTFSGEQPTATFTSTQGAGDEVSFDASGSTAPGGVARYDWQFNGGPVPISPTETTTPTVAHTFPAPGTYLVALTVYAPDGTSIGTAHSVAVSEPLGPPPSVTKLTPKTGSSAGGTSVTITGKHFSEVSAVRFGSIAAAAFTVNSTGMITAVSPAATSGAVDVTVTTRAGTSALTAADRFTFGAPTVTGVSPRSGPKAGASEVTITGSGFALGTATIFKFGAHAGTGVECSSSGSCTVDSPAAAKAGKVNVIATVGKQHSAKNAPSDQFTYM